ncbi:MAG: glycosyltransferase family 4 protein [Rhodothermales bacterium]|nr:glycosyltransferase family 4 protein [Rhodothermales bacterium]
MIIGVDVSCWSNRRGFGRFTRELVSAMVAVDERNEYIFFGDDRTIEEGTFPEKARLVAVRTSRAPTEAASASGRRSVGDMWSLTRSVAGHDMDVFFFPAVYSYFPVLGRIPVVVTIHDVIADRYPEATFPNRKLMLFWKMKQRLALFQSDLVLTVSQYSREMICDYYGLEEDRVRLTTESANDIFRVIQGGSKTDGVLDTYGLRRSGRYLLYVGGISPHKNLGRLVDAFGRLVEDESYTDVRLVLVGDYSGDTFHSDYPRLRRQIDDSGLEDAVIFTGYVPDDELVHLYNEASMLVFPSLEEGFGLPAVEAMSCGTPVAVSRAGSLPEIVGDAGAYFDPLDATSIVTCLRDLLDRPDELEAMGDRSLERMHRFTWETGARMAVDALESAVALR